MRDKDTDMTLPQIARELNVDALVEGSVQKVGESVRIRVRLIDALPQERNLWGQTYEKTKADILMLFSEVSRAIADKIKIDLTPEERELYASARKVNPKAYDAYLKGMFHWKNSLPRTWKRPCRILSWPEEKIRKTRWHMRGLPMFGLYMLYSVLCPPRGRTQGQGGHRKGA